MPTEQPPENAHRRSGPDEASIVDEELAQARNSGADSLDEDGATRPPYETRSEIQWYESLLENLKGAADATQDPDDRR